MDPRRFKRSSLRGRRVQRHRALRRDEVELGGSLSDDEGFAARIEYRDGRRASVPLLLRIDTPIEAAYFLAGAIMPYVLEQFAAQQERPHVT
jgi:aconitase A